MKNILLFIMISIFVKVSSQNDPKNSYLSGVYMTFDDYVNNKLSYQVDCTKEKFVIKMQDFFSKAYIDVIIEGKKHTLQKNNVFGYKDCDKSVFRFQNNKDFQLEDSGAIKIYTHEERVPTEKGYQSEIKFYFSKSIDSEIKPLTVQNLKIAFPDEKFHRALNTNFKDESDLWDYDAAHKMYKVNYVYATSLKK